LAITSGDSPKRGLPRRPDQRPPAPPPEPKDDEPFTPSGNLLKIMEGFDLDKDDKLSLEEIRTVSAPKIENVSKEGGDLADKFAGWEKAFPKADVDSDGYLTPREVGDLVQKATMNHIAGKMGGLGGAVATETDQKENLALAFVLWIANPKADEPPEQDKESQPQRNVTASAQQALDYVTGAFSEGEEPPTEVSDLKVAIEGGDESSIAAALYLLVVRQALDFDTLNGTMVPTLTDYTDTDDEKVQGRLMYAYRYGVNMAAQRYFSVAVLTDVVVNKLASRVNMDGPTFEAWLGVQGFLKSDAAESDTEAAA